jgi:type IV secretory pathway VirB9-like protein
MIIYTEERTYFIKLISTQSKFTPLTGFVYDDSAAGGEWLGQGGSMPTHASIGGGASGNIDFNYRFSGDNPSWKPVRAYSVGGKVYIDFPKDMQFATSPVLIGLNDDGGLFRSESEKMLIYRFAGNRMVVDGLFEHAKLVVGVGGRATEVDIRHKP